MLREECATLSDSVKDKSRLNLLSTFEVLLLQMGLQQLEETESATQILEELLVCYEKIVVTKPVKGEKTKKDEKDENEPNPFSVLLDILLDLLSKGSNRLRELVKSVFKVICELIPVSSILDLVEQLKGILLLIEFLNASINY